MNTTGNPKNEASTPVRLSVPNRHVRRDSGHIPGRHIHATQVIKYHNRNKHDGRRSRFLKGSPVNFHPGMSCPAGTLFSETYDETGPHTMPVQEPIYQQASLQTSFRRRGPCFPVNPLNHPFYSSLPPRWGWGAELGPHDENKLRQRKYPLEDRKDHEPQSHPNPKGYIGQRWERHDPAQSPLHLFGSGDSHGFYERFHGIQDRRKPFKARAEPNLKDRHPGY